ncbi:MAG TPA: YCF48-related protein [Solirubrobacteraceae bacterium]|nr:YCF48-related protein [Solirubrobacteraceae bacterium]
MHQWRRTNAPPASSRTDDIWFLDAERGWAVNSNGHILHTTDGGDTWTRQLSAGGAAYLRCVAFATEQRGWVGVIREPKRRLFETSDGGATWTVVPSLDGLAGAPVAVCGLSVVDEHVVYAAGTNEPTLATGVMKTVDGGRTWTAQAMADHATLLVDVFFTDADHGWVVGGRKVPGLSHPDPRDNVTPVVLRTEDGGATWRDLVAGQQLPSGEWGWKIFFVDDEVGYVSLENMKDGAVLKTVDGGMTWERVAITDPQRNANVEGLGFVDRDHGWVGGWGDVDFDGGYTSETSDGGGTWADANHVGKYLNRFRFVHEPELVGYASGDTVYKYSAAPVPAEPAQDAPRLMAAEAAEAAEQPLRTSFPIRIPLSPPQGARAVRVDVWDRFARHVATVLDEEDGAADVSEATWDGRDEDAEGTAAPGYYIFRVTIDDEAESGTLLVEA